MKLLSCLGLLAALCCCEAYRILVVFPLPSRSHGILGSGIVKPLLQAGHEVTYVTPFPLTDPPNNLHQVDVGFLQEKWQRNLSPNFLAGSSMSLSFLTSIGYNSSTALLECGQIQKILRDRNQKFDAVVTEWFFSDLFAGFGAVLQCPWILFSSVGMHAGLEYLTGEVQSPAVQPAIITGYSAPMSLYERVANTVIVFGSVLKTKFTDHPHDTPAYDRFFKTAAEARGVTIPDFTEAVTNISIILLNSHVSLGQAARLPPNAVEIGGYHIDTNTPELPKDLHDLLDHAQHGVIYFSMGSNLKSADLPVDKRNALMDVFRGLKETVLWKFETELPDVPKNVHIRSWFPQQSILAHKNVKMFITHGGLLSTTEAIHFGVPLIGIPVFGDQPMNMDRAVKMGYAIRVNLKSPQIGKDLGDSIKEMLANPSYRNTVQRLSKLFHDRPAHPASLVSYWTEHAVRTAGAQHLRTAASAVPAYQRYLLDILAILLAVLAIVMYVLRAVLRWILSKRSYKEKMY